MVSFNGEHPGDKRQAGEADQGK
ncbi:hypothetical protein HKBW3S06_01648, partial [Candidatus Hakubella thermalkaliphila]